MRAALAFILATCLHAGVVEFGGFETGDTSECAALTGSGQVTTATVYSGTYAIKAPHLAGPAESACGLTLISGIANDYWASVRYQVTGNPAAGADPTCNGAACPGMRFMEMTNSVTVPPTHVASCGISSGGFLFAFVDGGTAVTSSTPLAANTWYLIQAHITLNPPNSTVDCYIGSAKIVTSTGGTSTNSGTYKIVLRNFDATVDGFFDDVVVRNDALPGANYVSRRLAKSGTPTYNAWTLNGTCAGMTIDLCWNAVPFSTAASASDSATDAQTALVASFSASSPYGPAIGPRDTITACSASVIAKTATSGTFSIRRRVSGVNTDDAEVPTTSDAYYEGTIFVPALTALNSMEAGVVRTGGTGSVTVEDMWVECAFTAFTDSAAAAGSSASAGVTQ